jgi:hypothetical protein
MIVHGNSTILEHIRVLSFWIKRGYDSKKAEKRFLEHIRVLSAFG